MSEISYFHRLGSSWFRFGLIIAVSTVFSFSFIHDVNAASKTHWRGGGGYPASHATTVGALVFKERLEKLTNGTVTIDIFPDNQLGGQQEQIDQILSNQIQIAWNSTGLYDAIVPELAAATLPFSSTSRDEAICIMDNGLGQYFDKKLLEHGLIVLGWATIGARHVSNNIRVINNPSDMSGLKLRTLPSDVWTLTFKALGANPTQIDISELYQALQQGVVDGQENPYDNMVGRKFNEVQKYLSNTGHFFGWTPYLLNKDAFDKLTPDEQKAVLQAGAAATEAERQESKKATETARQALINGGMQYNEITPQALEEFKIKVAPVYDEMRKRLGNEVMDIAKNAISKCTK